MSLWEFHQIATGFRLYNSSGDDTKSKLPDADDFDAIVAGLTGDESEGRELSLDELMQN